MKSTCTHSNYDDRIDLDWWDGPVGNLLFGAGIVLLVFVMALVG